MLEGVSVNPRRAPQSEGTVQGQQVTNVGQFSSFSSVQIVQCLPWVPLCLTGEAEAAAGGAGADGEGSLCPGQ